MEYRGITPTEVSVDDKALISVTKSLAERKKKRRRIGLALLGAVVAGVVIGAVVALIVTLINLRPPTTTTTTTTTTSVTTTSETTTSSTSATTLSTTSSTTSTSDSTTTTSSATTLTSTTSLTTSSTSTTETTSSTSTTTTTTTVTTTTVTTVTTTTTSTTSTTSTTTGISCLGMQWNTTGTTVAGVTGSLGGAANQLNFPRNLFVDANYNIYIADNGNHRIQLWRAGATSGITVAGSTGSAGSSATQLNSPTDVFVDSRGNMYVADSGNNRIQFFPNGSTTGITQSNGWGGIASFRGVTVSPSNLIYAADQTNHALWLNNTVQLGYASAGGASNQLNSPQGIALDTTMNIGYVYIANAAQHTIIQWNLTPGVGNIVAGINGSQGSDNSTLRFPLAVKLDPLGNLFVADNDNHRIQLYCRYPTVLSFGRTVAGTGVQGSSATQLRFAAGVALDKDLNIYVSDNNNHRIQRFNRIV